MSYDRPLKLCAARSCDEIAEPGEAHCPEHLEERRTASNARKAQAKLTAVARAGAELYRTTRWRRLRLIHLAAHPLCADCGSVGLVTAATDVDHIKPHRGDPALFWARSNWQSLCHPCHSRKTAREVWHGGADQA